MDGIENLIYIIIIFVMIFIVWTRYLVHRKIMRSIQLNNKTNNDNVDTNTNKGIENKNNIDNIDTNPSETIENKTNIKSLEIRPIDKFYLSIYQFKILSPLNFHKSYISTNKLLELCDKVINTNDNSCGVTINDINTLKHNAIQYLKNMERSTDSCLLQNTLDKAITFLNNILTKKIYLATQQCQTNIATSPHNIYVKKLNIGPNPVNKYTDNSELFKIF